jgi:hypothetical protein
MSTMSESVMPETVTPASRTECWGIRTPPWCSRSDGWSAALRLSITRRAPMRARADVQAAIPRNYLGSARNRLVGSRNTSLAQAAEIRP